MLLGVAFAAALALGAIVQAILTFRDRRRFPPAGRLVEGLHVCELGSTGPSVVFEAGIAASCLGWTSLQRSLAAEARTWSYDRRGLGWSAPHPSARSLTLTGITDELRRLLRSLDVPRPFVLVAHSFGGYIATAYAHRFPADVRGLVLVDPITTEEWRRPTPDATRRLRRAVALARVMSALAACGLVRLGLWRLLRRGGGNPGPVLGLNGTLRRIAVEVAKLPPDAARALRARWSEPRYFLTIAANVRALPACAEEAAHHPTPPGMPVTVLSGAHQTPERVAEQAAMATRHVRVDGSTHWIHLDQSGIVRAEILQIAQASDA